MENFNGTSRATQRDKTPTGKWEFSRNILLSKGFTSITQEEGFDYKHDIPGIFIGKIDTNEEIIYFSIDGIYSCIGLYRTTEEGNIYTPILRTEYLNFKLNRPIEGVFYYNYRKELIVGFSDGIFEDSNTPKLINLTNIGVSLTPSFELVDPNDILFFELFSQTNEGLINIDYEAIGTLEADIVYVTYSYILSDGVSSSMYFPIHEVAYPTHNYRELDRRNIILNLTNLDINYNKLRIGLVVLTDTGLVGYQSSIRDYSGSEYSTTISSLNNFTTIATDELIVGKDVYSRVKTMTISSDELDIGNLVKENEIKFQKFANNLKLGIKYDIRPPSKYTHPTYCPDEVYSHYISLHLKNGTYTQEFHIPGNPANPAFNELTILTSGEITALGLDALNALDTYQRFRIFNTGGFVDNSIPPSPDNPVHLELRWGHWQNQEIYPNNDEYNGTIDYQGAPIVGGEDLRGTPIRYHRVPGLDALTSKFPSLLGYENKNSDIQLGRAGEGYFYGAIPSFGVNIINFDDICPQYIKDQIQGYRLSIVKRKSGERLVEDINFLKQGLELLLDTDNGLKLFSLPSYRKANLSGVSEDLRYNGSQFGYSRVRSNQLHTYKPSISAKLVKANYVVKDPDLTRVTTNPDGIVDLDLSNIETHGNVGGLSPLTVGNNSLYGKIPEAQKYAVISKVEYVPGNNVAAKTLYVEENVMLYANNTLQPPTDDDIEPDLTNNWNPLLITGLDTQGDTSSLTLDLYNPTTRAYEPHSYTTAYITAWKLAISATFINLPKNVYSGFEPRDFITIGRTILSEPDRVFTDGGDVFTNNLYDVPTAVTVRSNGDAPNAGLDQIMFNQLVIKGSFSVTNNNEIYIDKDRKYGRYYDMSTDNTQIEELLSFIYDLKIFNKETFRSLNDLIVGIVFSINSRYVNYYPFRIARSLNIATESLSTNNIRSFLANRYYDMPNTRGEIIALRGNHSKLYIQQKFSLFITFIKDVLNTDNSSTYLGEGDLFDRQPSEILNEGGKGYIGSNSQFACMIYKDGYVSVDELKGKIFLIGNGASEISSIDMTRYFEENWNTDNKYFNLDRYGNKQKLDNPYTQIGQLVGYDGSYRNRLLFTKKEYKFKFENLIGTTYSFDGEYYYITIGNIKLNYNDTEFFEETSITWSFDLYNKVWVCEHDYYPNAYPYTANGLYPVINVFDNDAQTYRTNSELSKGNYFGVQFESFVDLIFNSRYDLSKLYQAVEWVTQVIGSNNQTLYFETINKIMLYNNTQCSGIIDIPDFTFKISRNKENVWNFNSFRDIVIDRNLPLIDEAGKLNQSNVNFNRSWFEKSNFINTFIVVRMIMTNTTNNTIYIHSVNVKSRISDK